MGNLMIKEIFRNFKNNLILLEDIEYLFDLKDTRELEKFYLESKKVQANNFNKISFESNIFYPAIYQIENNCPTCGYRSIQSKQKYAEEFIIKSVEYRLSDIKNYPISGVNCYNKDVSGIRELLIILNTLEKYDLNVNVKVSNYDDLKKLNFNINSIICQSSLNKYLQSNHNNDQIFVEKYDKVLKYIKQKMKFKITYEFLIDYGESYHDIMKKICEIKKYDFDSIEIRGYDPFIDSPEEYNPQFEPPHLLEDGDSWVVEISRFQRLPSYPPRPEGSQDLLLLFFYSMQLHMVQYIVWIVFLILLLVCFLLH